MSIANAVKIQLQAAGLRRKVSFWSSPAKQI